MRHYPNWLDAYLQFTDESEAPTPFHFWAGVSAIAGALRRRVWIEEHHFQWSPNFYIIFVAPPGIATKSTTMAIGASMLAEVEGVKIGPQSLTWQGLTVALEEAKDVVMPDDEHLFPMSCLTIQSSELGTFLKPKDTELVDLLVDMWDGRKVVWRHRIKTGDHPSTEIVNPWINFIGCTTPAWMRGNFPAYMIEGGLTSRCIFLWGNEKRKLIPYPSDAIKRVEHDATRLKLVSDLTHIANLFGEYQLTREAKEWGSIWYREHWSGRPMHLISDRYGGYLARKQTHIHKLAMIVAASRKDELIITLDELKGAEHVVTSMELELQRVFKSIGMSNGAKNRTDVLLHIRHHGAVTQRALYRDMLTFMDKKELDDCIIGLGKSGLIQDAIVENQVGYQAIAGTDDNEPNPLTMRTGI